MPGPSFYYGLLLPIGIILIFNTVIFSIVIYRITCGRKQVGNTTSGSQNGPKASAEMLRRAQNAVAIGTLLGLTWVFGFLAIGRAQLAFNVLFTVFNSLQGVFIFLLFCLRQPDVQKVVRKKCACVVGAVFGGKTATGATSEGMTTQSQSSVDTKI